MKSSNLFLSFILGLTLFLTGCGTPRYEAPAPDESRTVVIWISIDGVRPDYFDRASLPFFEMARRQGAYSDALAPVFPSLTFPNHVSQATGTTVDQHGVPMNSFYDTEHERFFSYPGRQYLLQSEPIWTTAERQGRRTAILDWVLSYRQTGDYTAAYFGDGYKHGISDRRRIQRILDTWRRDRNKQPLQLFMGYMVTPDKVGHEFGPDAPEIAQAMRGVDADLTRFTRQALRLFHRRMDPEHDVLYLIITSDHGMSEVHTGVNPRRIAGISSEEAEEHNVIIVSSGNLAHFFLHHIEDDTERADWETRIIATATQHDFVESYRRDELPEHWGFAHPTRVGDVLLVLPKGYAFSRRTPGLFAPQEEGGPPLGMHGYDVEDNPEMNGFALFWRYPEPLGGIDLGPTHALQLHATVANLLGINPADAARQDPIVWE